MLDTTHEASPPISEVVTYLFPQYISTDEYPTSSPCCPPPPPSSPNKKNKRKSQKQTQTGPQKTEKMSATGQKSSIGQGSITKVPEKDSNTPPRKISSPSSECLKGYLPYNYRNTNSTNY